MPFRVVLRDDHVVLRAGVELLLATELGFEVVGGAADGAEVVAKAVELRPDVAVLDITIPHLDGVEAARRLRLRAPAVKVPMLAMHDDPVYLFQARDAGVSGYLRTRAAGAELREAEGAQPAPERSRRRSRRQDGWLSRAMIDRGMAYERWQQADRRRTGSTGAGAFVSRPAARDGLFRTHIWGRQRWRTRGEQNGSDDGSPPWPSWTCLSGIAAAWSAWTDWLTPPQPDEPPRRSRPRCRATPGP
jgi:CheY-like chemotaxis protein